MNTRLTYDIDTIRSYINWPYFYHACQMKDPEGKKKLRQEAEEVLDRLAPRYHTYALFAIVAAYSEGDDIMVVGGRGKMDDGRGKMDDVIGRIPCLRQQQVDSHFLCLADFIAPKPSCPATLSYKTPVTTIGNTIGLFATSVDHGLESDFDSDPYMKMMVQLLADRLAEATAERMHEEVRKDYWGYAPDEQLSMDDLHMEHFQGIRPAVGYPSLPDTSLNFVLDQLIDMKQIGIRLTENGAMKPHASVSGLMLAHPKARYFNIGKIGTDQLNDYARRRGLPMELMRRFLAANL